MFIPVVKPVVDQGVRTPFLRGRGIPAWNPIKLFSSGEQGRLLLENDGLLLMEKK